MTRRTTYRYRARAALPPRGLRPKLAPDQLRDLSLAHHVNVDALASGSASPAILADYVESVLVWSQVAERVGGDVQMDAQTELATAVVARFRDTGAVFLTDEEIELARDGVVVMDKLAAAVDNYSAIEATVWARNAVAGVMGQGVGA